MANEVIKKNAKIIRENLRDDGTFPNNANLPTLIYQGALDVGYNRRGVPGQPLG